jgi:hypothetical protein
MGCNNYFQLFTYNFVEGVFRLIIPITTLIALFYLFYGAAYADLSTIPPQKVQEEYLDSNQRKIESLLVKARAALSKKRLTTPKNNNVAFYLDQLLLLSPDNKHILNISTEVYYNYIGLAYKKLDKNNIELAQEYYDMAEKIVQRSNINIDSQDLIGLQDTVNSRQAKINALSIAAKARTSAEKIEQKKHIMTGLANLQREIVLNQSKMDQFKVELITPTEASKTEKIAQKNNKEQTTHVQHHKDQQPHNKQENTLSIIGSERVVVIVNKNNKISSLTLRELKSLYKEKKRTWPNGERVALYLPPPNSDEFLWLTRNIFLEESPTPVIQFYMKGLNRNKLKMPYTTTNSVLDVSRIEGGIAIVKAKETKGYDSIKIISVDGK